MTAPSPAARQSNRHLSSHNGQSSSEKFSVKVQTTQWRRRHLMVAAGRAPPTSPSPLLAPARKHAPERRVSPSLFPLSSPPWPVSQVFDGRSTGTAGARRRCRRVAATPRQAMAPQHRQRPVAPRGGLRRAQGSVTSPDFNAHLKTPRTPQNVGEEDDAPQARASSIRRLKVRRVAAASRRVGRISIEAKLDLHRRPDKLRPAAINVDPLELL